MMNLSNFLRRTRTVPIALVAVAASACDLNTTLLEPQQPGVIDPTSVTGATGAEALRVGALGRLARFTAGGNNNQEGLWQLSGLLTDEYKSGDTFTQRNEIDQRNVQANNGNVQSEYTVVQQSRGYASDALAALKAVNADGWKRAQMLFVAGFAEMTLGELFCNGIPLGTTEGGVPKYTQPLTNVQVLQAALARYDEGLTAVGTATDVNSTEIRYALRVARARTLIDLGRFTDAATAIGGEAGVPTNFQFVVRFSTASTTDDNNIWTMFQGTRRYIVGDSVDLMLGTTTENRIFNAIPYPRLGDPRVPTAGDSKNAAGTKGFDTQTPYVEQRIWTGRDDPVPVVSGIDARLIEAEAQLKAGDYLGMMLTLNALRGGSRTIGTYVVPAMPALVAAPTTEAEAADIFFREKALWTYGRGQRMNDLRRMVRQYLRPQNTVFPSGTFFKGGSYGSDVNFPVTDNEKNNPNFKGCTDRAA